MELWHNRILVLDFGSQYTQLIARRIREAQVYSQILPCTVSLATILAYRPQGIVLSGGPSSVYEKKAPTVPKEIFDLGIPILGICYGMQLVTHLSGGEVAKSKHREYGRAELTIVHVLSPVMPIAGDGYVSPRVYEELAASGRAWGQKQLGKLIAKARTAGVRAKGMLVDGIPHEQILRAAKAKRADLVVLGTHGRSGLARLFVGSVAGRVVAAARCPVLTVRGG